VNKKFFFELQIKVSRVKWNEGEEEEKEGR
jgi:hypothetical protein